MASGDIITGSLCETSAPYRSETSRAMTKHGLSLSLLSESRNRNGQFSARCDSDLHNDIPLPHRSCAYTIRLREPDLHFFCAVHFFEELNSYRARTLFIFFLFRRYSIRHSIGIKKSRTNDRGLTVRAFGTKWCPPKFRYPASDGIGWSTITHCTSVNSSSAKTRQDPRCERWLLVLVWTRAKSEVSYNLVYYDLKWNRFEQLDVARDTKTRRKKLSDIFEFWFRSVLLFFFK